MAKLLRSVKKANFALSGFSELRIHGALRSSACETLRASTNRPLSGSIFAIHDRLRTCQTNAPSTTRIPVSAENASTLVSSGLSTAGPSNPPTK